MQLLLEPADEPQRSVVPRLAGAEVLHDVVEQVLQQSATVRNLLDDLEVPAGEVEQLGGPDRLRRIRREHLLEGRALLVRVDPPLQRAAPQPLGQAHHDPIDQLHLALRELEPVRADVLVVDQEATGMQCRGDLREAVLEILDVMQRGVHDDGVVPVFGERVAVEVDDPVGDLREAGGAGRLRGRGDGFGCDVGGVDGGDSRQSGEGTLQPTLATAEDQQLHCRARQIAPGERAEPIHPRVAGGEAVQVAADDRRAHPMDLRQRRRELAVAPAFGDLAAGGVVHVPSALRAARIGALGGAEIRPMTQSIQIPDSIREQLRLSFLTEPDFLAAMQQEELVPVAHPPGCFRGRPTLAVPRPLDPETAEMRQLEVYLRPIDGGLEVFAIRGLDLEALAE